MTRSWGLLASTAIAVVGTGCGGGGSSNPLVGEWTRAVTSGTTTITETIHVNSDGSLSYTLTGSSSGCSGSQTYTGFTWAATSSSVTVSGTAACSGTITCGTVSVACSTTASGVSNGSCTYSLIANDDTLTLSQCTSKTNDGAYTRGS